MKNKLRKLKTKRYVATIMVVLLFVFVLGLTSLLKPMLKNIKINNIVSKTTSLNASVIDGTSEGVISNNYDEIKYTIKVEKESDNDEAIIIGTLTDKENKYARFKTTKEGVVTENGKKITVTTKKKKVTITVIIENAPYGTTINPKYKINSQDENKSKVEVEPVTITGKSVEGKVLDENGTLYTGIELGLSSNGEEVKRTYTRSDGDYVFSLGDLNAYEVNVKEDKYKIVRYSEETTDENRRVLNVVIKEVEPFNLNIKKTISKLDLTVNGKKQTFNYNDEEKVVKSLKNAKTIEGSIYYNISIKNEGEIKGTLTALKDVIPEGLSFDKEKNPGWTKEGKTLFYTPLEGEEIDAFGKTSATLILDIKKTEAARTYINKAIANGEDYKYVAYYLNNQIYREEYVIANEKIENINPGVEKFAGWYTDKKYTNRYDFENEVTKDLILFGKINDNKYTVTFIDVNPNNGAETILDIVEVNEGESVDLIDHPEYRGYTFKCFELNNACYQDEPITDDVTIYTSYTVNDYEIVYNLDDGELESGKTNPDTYTVRDTFTLNNPSKEGFTFTGWSGTDLSEKTITVTIPKGSIGDREYTANYEKIKSTLTIDPNGGTYRNNASTVSYTEEYGTVKQVEDSVRRGYEFLGYKHDGGGIYSSGSYTFDNEDGLLTAQYDIITYSISYENITPEERAFLDNPISYNVETETFTLKNPNTRVDYLGNPIEDFLGWDDGNGNVSLTVTIPKGSTGDRTYTAVWGENQNSYSITYELHDGEYETGKTNPSTYTRQTETFTLNNPGKDGYNFTGWSGTELIGTENTTVTITKGSAGNRAYEAHYTVIPYTISYENITPEERAFLDNPISYNIETETFTLKNPNTRVDDQGNNYQDFLGWNDGNGNTSLTVTIPKGSIGNRTYTAVWRENEDDYAITYELHGGELASGKSNPSTYTRQTPTFTLNNPGKLGYTFKGWSGTELTGTENTTVTIAKGSAGDRAYEANYTLIPYTISYDNITPEERTFLDNPIEYNIETETFTLKNPNTRVDNQGYNYQDFLGWDDGDGNVSLTVTIPKGSTGNRVYTAVWRENQDIYDITYELHGGEYETGKTNPNSYTRQTETFTLNNPGKTGYTFKGWSGTGLTGIENTTVTIPVGSAGDRAYEANYQVITYSITYDYDDGVLPTGVTNPTEYTIESDTINIANPSKEGYEFLGWSGTDIADKSTSVIIPHGSTGDRVYTANFKKIEYSLTYTLNGGHYKAGESNPDKYTVESPDITLNNPEKDGYTFKGWSGTDLTGDENTTVTIPHGSMGHRSFLANYIPIPYSITYDYDGGSLPIGVTNPSTYTIETEDITFNTPSKEGYTFLNYTIENVITTGIPKGSIGDKHVVAHYEIEHYKVTYYNDSDKFAEVPVDWNELTTEISAIPTKAHNIFLRWSEGRYWLDEDTTAFDFANTYIRENRTLYAVYEEVLPPVITLNPTLDDTTNRTWVCGDETNDTCGVTVTIENNPALTDTTGYSIYYKVGDGAATLYTGPFPVYSNETITAFAEKSNISSENTTADIVNVDTIAPTINQPSTGSMSFNITVRGVAQDASSGVKKFTLYVKEKDALVFDDILTYTSEIFDGIKDHSENYDHTFAVKHDDTEYIVKIVAEDYVGNISEREVEVKTNPYVARVVGKNGILWYTVDPDTKEFVFSTPFLPFDSIQMAIDYCAEMQCTIQTNPIYSTVNESVTIGDNQNITIDLDGRNISSDENSTFVNNGELHIVDRNPRLNGTEHESIGKVINTTGKAIINNGHFILGDGSAEPSETFIYPELDRPIIEGYQAAIEQNNTFYFFDGRLISDTLALIDNGGDPITQYSYNVIVENEDSKNIGYLSIVDDPEARINSTYYTKLKANGLNAFDSSRIGTVSSDSYRLLSKIKQAGTYGFVYDEVNDLIYSGNSSTANTTALSYLKLDLTEDITGQFMSFDTYIDSYNSNSIGYVYVSEELGNTGTEIFRTTGNDATGTKLYYLDPGKTYYIYFKFVKSGGYINSQEIFKINNFKLLGERTEENDVALYNDYNYYPFAKQADGTYISTNKGSDRSYSHSYLIYDLRDETENINLYVNLSNNSSGNRNYGYVYLSNNEKLQDYSVENGRYALMTGNMQDVTYNIPLEAGKVNFVHFAYRAYNYDIANEGLTINSVMLTRTKTEDLIPTSTFINSGSYYFEKLNYDPSLWKDSSENNSNAKLYGPVQNAEGTGYVFDGNDYVPLSEINPEEFTWYTKFNASANNSVIMANYESGGEGINIDGNKIRLEIYIDGSYQNLYSTDTIEYGRDYEVYATYKDGTAILYVDGVEQARYEGTTLKNPDSNTVVMLGANPGGTSPQGNYFQGTIYNVKIYDKALTAEEITGSPVTENLVINLDGSNSHVMLDDTRYISNNYMVNNSTAHSYLVYDLTTATEDKYLYVNTSISSESGRDIGYVQVTNSDSLPSDTNGRNISISGEYDNQTGIFRLKKNQINYVHFVYSKNGSNSIGKDSFVIKEVKLFNNLEDVYSINPNNNIKVDNYYFDKPTLNDKVDTIELLKNITLNTSIVVPQEKEVVLDLNGFTLTSNKEDYIIKNNGKLTITDSEYRDRHQHNIDYKIEQARLFEQAKAQYFEDLTEYQEYAGLCDGCSPSEEYILDSSLNKEIDYTGTTETYTAIWTNSYKLQVWGAQGGYRSSSDNGGKGGYSEGIIELQEGDTLYITVGGSGNTGGTSGGFNGGGSKTTYPGGGGATDIRVEGDTLYHRIIVAGGGGSDGAANKPGGAAGGLSGVSRTENYGSGGSGGTQTAGGTHRGAFGLGGSGGYYNGGSGGGGFGGAGGGGWYGGGGVNPDRSDDDRGGGGGSGFVYTDSTTVPVEGYLVSNHVLTDATIVGGTESMPTYDGTSTMVGNSGDGYARIKALLSDEEIQEIKANLPKTYNIKKKPIFKDYLSEIDFDSSVDINNLTPDSTPSYSNEFSDTYQGSIITTIYDALLNEQYGTLIIDGSQINVNVNSKSGVHNRGKLIVKNAAEINANNSSTIGIFNESNGTIEFTSGVINSVGSSTIGLINRSNTSNINNLKVVTNQANATGVINENINDVTYNNLDVSGAGVGFREFSPANTVITNSNIKSTGNNSLYSANLASPNKLTINSSNFSGTFGVYDNAKITYVNNSNLSSLYNYIGDVRVYDSTLGYIDNRGITNINNSTISGGGSSGNLINNNSVVYSSYYDYLYQYSSKMIIKDSIVNSTTTSTSAVIINNNDHMIIDNTIINNINKTKSTAISNNKSNGEKGWLDLVSHLSITGTTSIDPEFGTAISNNGVLTLGSKDKNVETVYEYGYSGKQEEFTAPEDGIYKLETWGASSSGSYYNSNYIKGGLGAYASGNIELHQGDKLYVHVGGVGVYGENPAYEDSYTGFYGSYNGGGPSSGNYNGAGGGATDISLSDEDNTWYFENGVTTNRRSQASYQQRLIVAGGGSSYWTRTYNASVNTQPTADIYGGYDVDPSTSQLGYGNTNGGGGYYGGSYGLGGSSYVSNTLTNTVLKKGNEEMPDFASGSMVGNYGSGYAKITLLNSNGEIVGTNPSISATNYGITGPGKVIYYDGTMNAKVAVNSDIDEVPEDYDIYNSLDSNMNEKMILVANADSRPVADGSESYVAAIGSAKYTTIQNALDASNNGDEIDLLVNIEEQNKIVIPQDMQITIDYNGHTVKTYNNDCLFENHGNLTITDSTNTLGKNTFTGDRYIYNDGTLSISNVYIGNHSYSTSIINNNDGTVTMNGVKIDFGNPSVTDKTAITNTENGSITVSNSIMNLTNANNFFSNKGSLTLTNNTITNNDYGRYFVNNVNSGVVILDGNSYSVSGNDTNGRYLLANNGSATATIKNMTTLIEDVYNLGDLTLEGNNIPSGTIYNEGTGLVKIIDGIYKNTFNNSSTGRAIDNTDVLYSFVMNDGTINTTLNRTGTGTFDLRGGTISVSSINSYAINNTASGVINLGIHDGNVDSKTNTKPVITGKAYGLYTVDSNLVVNFYDGIITAQKAYNVTIADIEPGYSIAMDYDLDNDLETKYLTIEPIFTNDTQGINYNSVDELNEAISDGLVNNDDVIKTFRNITLVKNENTITIPSGLKITFDINGKRIDKNNLTMFIINGEMDVIDSVNNSSGLIDSTNGSIFVNNGTLNIISGKYTSERGIIESEIVKNNENATLTVAGGTLTKYYDRLDYRRRNTGSVINNSGTATVTGGTFYSNGSFVSGYYERIYDKYGVTSHYYYISSVFDNRETGNLTVTGGTYDGITSANWNDSNSSYSTGYNTAKGELINNYGTATISNITSLNSRLGDNNGTLIFNNVTMPDIQNISCGRWGREQSPNSFNYGDFTINDSSFTLYNSFIENDGGNLTINNTTLDRVSNGTTYYGSTTGWNAFKTTQLIMNYNNDSIININDSNLYNRGSGEVIDNRGIINMDGTTLSASNNNAINNTGGSLNIEDSDITAKNTTINSTSSSTVTIIKNSSIVSTSGQAIINSSSTLILGKEVSEDGEVSQTNPMIKGETYGINNSGTIYFYDGIIKGKTNQINGVYNNLEAGYTVINGTDNGYKTNYLDRVPIIQNITQATQTDEKKYYDLKTAFDEAVDGDTLQLISDYSNLPADLTAINNHNVTFDLNGYYIRQANSLLITNNGTLNIIDGSQNTTGQIIGISGTKMIDNYGTINFTGGKLTSNTFTSYIKNNSTGTIIIRDNAKIVSSVIATLIDNDGIVNIYNGAYLQNLGGDKNVLFSYNTGVPMIINRNELNIIDLNNDDDENTSSSLTAPWLYSIGNANVSSMSYKWELYYHDAIIRNDSGATANIYGGIYNNGSTTSPDSGSILWNSGTATIKNLNNYSFCVGWNDGTLNILNSHFYNFQEGALSSPYGTLKIKDTIINFHALSFSDGVEGNTVIMNLGNAELDNVTITGGNHTNGNGSIYSIRVVSPTVIKNSNLSFITESNSITNVSTLTIKDTPINIDKSISNSGTLILDNSSVTSSGTGIDNSGTLNLINGTNITATGGNAINISGGTVNVPIGSNVISTNGRGINMTGGILNLGEIGGNPDITSPYVEGTSYGVYRDTQTPRFNFYDGLIVGQTGPDAIYGGVSSVEGGYETENNPVTDPDTSIQKYNEYLVVSATSVVIAQVGTYRFTTNSSTSSGDALQNAVIFAIGDGTNIKTVNLVANVDLVNDQVSVTATKPVTINTNGFTIRTNSTYNLSDNITLNTGGVGGNVSKLLGDVFDINNSPKDILVYELSDGSRLDTTKTYKLYRDDKIIGLEKEELGKYRYRGDSEELTAVRGRLYLNNLNKGSYRLVSSDNKSIEFSIDSDGNISGNVTEYDRSNNSTAAVAESEAELILQIQTGVTKHYYLLLIIPIILIIISLVVIIRKNKEREI